MSELAAQTERRGTHEAHWGPAESEAIFRAVTHSTATRTIPMRGFQRRKSVAECRPRPLYLLLLRKHIKPGLHDWKKS